MLLENGENIPSTWKILENLELCKVLTPACVQLAGTECGRMESPLHASQLMVDKDPISDAAAGCASTRLLKAKSSAPNEGSGFCSEYVTLPQ